MKNIRILIIGLFAGVLLATSATAFAGPALERIAATLRPDYKVKVDGTDVKLQNAPLSYEGTTYVPLREAGEIFGYKVGFKAGTITLDAKDVEPVSESNSGTNVVEPSSPEIDLSEWVSFSDLNKQYPGLSFKTERYPGTGKGAFSLMYKDFVENFEVDSITVGDKIYTNDSGNQLLIPGSSGGGIMFKKEFIESFVNQ